jgi:FKBP-type peptidyl-prolyl cis-trans isomerase
MRRISAMFAFGCLLLCLGFSAGCADREVSVKETPVTLLSEKEGFGRPAKKGDIVTVHIQMKLPDGTIIIDQRDFAFELGVGAVVEGVDDTVLGMKERGKRSAVLPPHKHWGSNGYGEGRKRIPPNTRLRLDVTLVDIN